MMKRLSVILSLIALIMAIGSLAQATTIRDHTPYVASTGLTLGAAGAEWGGETGFTITDPFQINLEYQAGILDADIDALNSYAPAVPGWTLNYSDNDEYVLKIDVSGGLSTWEYPDAEQGDSGNANIQWTLTAWHQTILAGYIDGQRLVVSPANTYRPFPNDPPVNDVEVFSGLVKTEVIAYTFTGNVGDIGNGSVLGVQLVPEPTTALLLAAGLTGLAAMGRRRSLR